MDELNLNSMINHCIQETIQSRDSRNIILLSVFHNIFFDVAIKVICFSIRVGWFNF